MSEFTPAQFRTAADVAAAAPALGGYAKAWRAEADRLEARQTEDAYLDGLIRAYCPRALSVSADRDRMRAVLAKLEADGRLLPTPNESLTAPKVDFDGPWDRWEKVPEGVWYKGSLSTLYVNVGGKQLFAEPPQVPVCTLPVSVDGHPFHRVPRVWQGGDPEPEGVVKVRDRDGVYYEGDGEGSYGAHGEAWGDIAFPVTEVLPEETNR